MAAWKFRPRRRKITTTDMKALLGIDAQGGSDAAVALFHRLSFSDCKVTLLHSVESLLPDGSFPGDESTHVINEMMEEIEATGRAALDRAAANLPEIEAAKRSVMGDPLRNLLDIARQDETDLIVVGSENKSPFEKAIMGSVTRGLLASAPHSFLVGKRFGSAEGPVTAIFATDHSDYSDRCLDTLLRFAPKGIGTLILFHVVEPESVDPQAANEALCNRAAPLATDCRSLLGEGPVERAIHDAMIAQNADLVIVGAQGCGFLKRLRMGSTSFFEVESEPYSALVLRP